MEILFLSTVLPHGRASGGEIATHALLDGLAAAGHDVTVVGYRRTGEQRDPPAAWIEVGERPIETDEAGRRRTAAWMTRALLRRLPYSAAKYHSRAYLRTVRDLLDSGRFELAVVDHGQIGWVLPDLERAGVPFVHSCQNVEELHYEALAAESHGTRRWLLRREARLIAEQEQQLARRGRAVWTVAEADTQHFRRFGQAREIPVPSNFTGPPASVSKRCDIALMGTWTWDATREALQWFLEQVAPRLPDGLTVEVAGRGGDWIDGAHPGVRYRGFVPDALAFLASARVVAVPGVGVTGIQIKTLDAIAAGAEVVATPAAVRAMPAPPSSVHVAETPEEFARELARLARAPESLDPSQAGIEWTRQRRERFRAAVAEAVEAAVSAP